MKIWLELLSEAWKAFYSEGNFYVGQDTVGIC